MMKQHYNSRWWHQHWSHPFSSWWLILAIHAGGINIGVISSLLAGSYWPFTGGLGQGVD
jgi:hypothetical protein